MKRKKKKPLLQVGDRFVIVTKNTLHKHWAERVEDYEVVRANTSSAYAVRVSDLDKKEPYEKRIDQRTRRPVTYVASFDIQVMYESREEYEMLKARREKLLATRSSVVTLVSSLEQPQLEEILSTYGQSTPIETNK